MDYFDCNRMVPLEQYSQVMLLYFLFLKTVITLAYGGLRAHSGERVGGHAVSLL